MDVVFGAAVEVVVAGAAPDDGLAVHAVGGILAVSSVDVVRSKSEEQGEARSQGGS